MGEDPRVIEYATPRANVLARPVSTWAAGAVILAESYPLLSEMVGLSPWSTDIGGLLNCGSVATFWVALVLFSATPVMICVAGIVAARRARRDPRVMGTRLARVAAAMGMYWLVANVRAVVALYGVYL